MQLSGTVSGARVSAPRRLALGLAMIGALFAAAATGSQAQAASTQCPGTFSVLHNDRIGSLSLPAGRYEIIVGTPTSLTCAQASDLFAKFLQRYEGNLPDGWRVNANRARFSNPRTDQAFRVRKAGTGGGGGGGGGTGGAGGGGNNTPSGRNACPGTFQVLHNDRVGRLRIPAGNYVITVKRMSCSAASDLFRKFLARPEGNLPDGWQVKPRKAKFRNAGTGESFRIKRA
jgi:hypothetical protein